MKIMFSVALLMAALLQSCASSPTGSAELMKRIEADLKMPSKAKRNSISEGRPVFMDIQSYPQILPSGDLWLGGDMLLNVGREELNFTELAERYLNEPKPESSGEEPKP